MKDLEFVNFTQLTYVKETDSFKDGAVSVCAAMLSSFSLRTGKALAVPPM